jgi:anti-sigma B factor antagonist
MQFEERTVGDVVILKITGDITLKHSRGAMLHDKVRAVAEQGHKKVLLDLAGVSFVDSAGLGELVQSNSTIRNRGGALKLSNPSAHLREMLTLTRLTTVLSLHDDEAAALASFGAPAVLP